MFLAKRATNPEGRMESPDRRPAKMQSQTRNEKTPYVSPQLVRYGTIVELTKGEGTQVPDGFGNGDIS